MSRERTVSTRALMKRVVPTAIRRRLRPPMAPWVRSESQPATPVSLQTFAFYAIVGTWMEEDVIADTVANAFAQGIDRVFLLDNESPDHTVARAVEAGAEHVLTYRTRTFEEKYRYNLMNEFVRHLSETGEFDHVWWLWLDADEFPRPQDGGTLRAMLEALDHRYRVVGARFINHYPSPGNAAYVTGDHPLDHQPLCEEMPYGICDAMHRKHPLQRWDRNGPRIDAGLGFHRAECEERPLIEPTTGVVIDHFPFRSEDATRRRMAALWGGANREASRAKKGDIATDHMEARMRSLDAVYAGDWDNVYNFLPGAPEKGVQLLDWHELRPPISDDVHRWNDSGMT